MLILGVGSADCTEKHEETVRTAAMDSRPRIEGSCGNGSALLRVSGSCAVTVPDGQDMVWNGWARLRAERRKSGRKFLTVHTAIDIMW